MSDYGWKNYNFNLLGLNNDGVDDTAYKYMDIDGDGIIDNISGEVDIDYDGFVDFDYNSNLF